MLQLWNLFEIAGTISFAVSGAILTALAMSWLFATYRIAGRKKQIVTFFYVAADTVGLASFTVTGTLTGLSQGTLHTYVYPVLLGLITAVGGGVMRDLMAQRVPSVLTADVYATASLAGSLVMCLCWHFESQDLAPFLIALRFFAIRYRWQLVHPMEKRKNSH